MKKILWVSRHHYLESQLKELKKLFDEIRIEKMTGFRSAEDIVKRYREGGYDEMVVVAPLSVIARITEKGIKPLWAEMKLVEPGEEFEVEAKGRYYKFREFKRIKRVTVEFEEEI